MPGAVLLRRLALLGLVAALSHVVTPAHAAPEKGLGPQGTARSADGAAEASRHFAEAQRAFDAKDYRRAAAAFERAYASKPHHAPLWNAARSWKRAGEDVRAANLYARYLREAPGNAPNRDGATADLREIARRIGRLEPVTAEGVTGVRVDSVGVEAPVWYVAPGEHLVEADAKGAAIAKTVAVGAGESISVALEAPSPPPDVPAVVTPIVVASPPGADVPLPPPRAAERERRRPLPRAIVLVGAGLTLVGAGLTVASGLDTVADKHAFDRARTERSRLEEARASEVRTNVALGITVGVAVIVGTLAAFFTDWRHR